MSQHDARIYRLAARAAILMVGAGLLFNPAPAQALQSIACDVSWLGGDGSWHDSSRWSSNSVPGPADHVCVAAPGTYTVVLDADATVAGVNIGLPNEQSATLRIDRASLTLLNESTPLTNFGTIRDNRDVIGDGSEIFAPAGLENAGAFQIHGDLALIALTNLESGVVSLNGASVFLIDSDRPLRNAGTLRVVGEPSVVGLLFGSVENSGLIEIEQQLALPSFTSTETGRIRFDLLSPLAAAPTVAIFGDLSLDGTVELSVGDASQPGPGDVFELIAVQKDLTAVVASVVTNRPGLGGSLGVVGDRVVVTLEKTAILPAESGNAGLFRPETSKNVGSVLAIFLTLAVVVALRRFGMRRRPRIEGTPPKS